jgi:hypothetical protein
LKGGAGMASICFTPTTLSVREVVGKNRHCSIRSISLSSICWILRLLWACVACPFQIRLGRLEEVTRCRGMTRTRR